MRTSVLVSAAFAGCALAGPLVKRDVVVEIDTVTDIEYTTAYVTQTAGANPVAEVTSAVLPATSTESSVETTTTPAAENHWFKSWSWGFSTEIVEGTTEATTLAASTSAPVVASSTSVYVAPSSTAATASTSSAAEVSPDFNNILKRTATPTCNPNNVRILTNYFPSPTAYCKRLQAAMPSPTNKIAPSLNLKQSNNICSCVLAGKYVSNTPLTSIKTTTTKASSTSSSASSKATTYQERVLVHHNVHRANHSASALTWSANLAAIAQSIGETCVYAHNTTAGGGGYGQNIAAGVQAANISAVITDLFYNGEVNYFNGLYGQANPSMTNFESWGHFSQIVWKATTQVGCATVDCSSSGLANVGQYVSPYFTVCNYESPGNYAGEYGTNIGASLNRATVGWDYGL